MIRRARQCDSLEIFKLLAQTSSPWSMRGIEESINSDMCLVSEEGSVDGVVFCRVLYDECEILNFAVDKDKKRQGVGTRLLQETIKQVQKKKIGAIYLDVRASNTAAISLYRKFDFEVFGERKNFYTKPRENAVLMKKHLKFLY